MWQTKIDRYYTLELPNRRWLNNFTVKIIYKWWNKSLAMSRRASLGVTFTRRGSSSTNPKVIVPRKRLIVTRTLSDASSCPKLNSHSQERLAHNQLIIDNTSSTSLYPTTVPVNVGNDNIIFSPEIYTFQHKRYS